MKCKLLVAEDELIERKVLCRTLQKYLGDLISLYEAKNGREALEILPAKRRRWRCWTLKCRVLPGWRWRVRSAKRTKLRHPVSDWL